MDATSEVIKPEDIPVVPDVMSVTLTVDVKEAFNKKLVEIGLDAVDFSYIDGFAFEPHNPLNPYPEKYFIAVRTELDGITPSSRFQKELEHGRYDTHVGELVTTLQKVMQGIQELDLVNEDTARIMRTHEEMHRLQEIRFGTLHILTNARIEYNKNHIQRTNQQDEKLLSAISMLTVLIEAQAMTNEFLDSHVTNDSTKYSFLQYCMGGTIQFFEEQSGYGETHLQIMIRQLQTSKFFDIGNYPDHLVGRLLMLHQNAYVLDTAMHSEITADQLTEMTSRRLLSLLHNPEHFLKSLRNENFLQQLDLRIYEKTEELKTMLD